MKYMGSKRRLAKYIAPIIQGFIDGKNHNYNYKYKTYIEPFVGGANMIEHIKCENRCGSDINGYLIALLQFVADGHCHEIPDEISETLYNLIKNHHDGYPSWLVGFCGFNATFGAKWFGGYARPRKNTGYDRDVICGKNALVKQGPLISDVEFSWHSYTQWAPENCVVYCDPPYQGVTAYKDHFNHVEFWNWCQEYAKPEYNNVILVSEYTAPEFCTKVIWEKEIENTLSKDAKGKKGIEKLFMVILTKLI